MNLNNEASLLRLDRYSQSVSIYLHIM